MATKKAANRRRPADTDREGPDAKIRRLEQEIATLRSRLAEIARLASTQGAPLLHDHDEEDEEDELLLDVDDQIAGSGKA